MKTKKLHYFSGLTITVFIVFHLLNHVFSIESAEKHIQIMDTFRLVYRHPFAETILLVAVCVQIISGLKLFSRKRKIAYGFFEKLHIWSGLYLAFFFIIHLSAIMVGRYVLKVDTNFYFGVAGLNAFPFNLFFIPYYACAILAFFSHIAAIHHSKMQQPILGLSPLFQSFIIIFSGILITILIFYGLINGFAGVEMPLEYQL